MFPIDQTIIKIEYNERLRAAELERRIRKSTPRNKWQIKEAISALWKRLPQATPAKPALRTK